MQFGSLASKAQKLISDNAPLILTTVGVVGAVGTAVLTGKAAYKSAEIIRSYQARTEEQHPGAELTVKAKIQMVWPEFVPAAISLTMTVTSIVFANRIGTRRAAALASAYSLTDRLYKQYEKKIDQVLDPEKKAEVKRQVAEDILRENPPSEEIRRKAAPKDICVLDTDMILCMDMWTRRTFLASMNQLDYAENQMNREMQHAYYVPLSKWYQLIGLTETPESDEVGWNTNNEFEVSRIPAWSDDGQPCIAIEFRVMPNRDFQNWH